MLRATLRPGGGRTTGSTDDAKHVFVLHDWPCGTAGASEGFFTRVVCETGREHPYPCPYPSIPGRSTLEYLQFNRNVTLLSSPVTAHVGVGGWIEKGPLV